MTAIALDFTILFATSALAGYNSGNSLLFCVIVNVGMIAYRFSARFHGK